MSNMTTQQWQNWRFGPSLSRSLRWASVDAMLLRRSLDALSASIREYKASLAKIGAVE